MTKKLIRGGLATGALFIGAAGYASYRAEVSNDKALEISNLSETYKDPYTEKAAAFIAQNEHTKDLGDWEHYLRMVGGGVILMTLSAAAGIAIGRDSARHEQRAESELIH